MKYPNEDDPPLGYDDLGKEIRPIGPQRPTSGRGALIPLSQRVIYQSGGRLTESDRQLYSLDHNIPKKTKIMYKGETYHVESKLPLEDYADFSVYMLKGVDAFD